jgi:hypothetical protein
MEKTSITETDVEIATLLNEIYEIDEALEYVDEMLDDAESKKIES